MKITLKDITNVPAGVALRLTPEQKSAREHALEPYGKQKNVYVGMQSLTFKEGETIEVVGDLPKGILPIYDKLCPVKNDVAVMDAKEPETDQE